MKRIVATSCAVILALGLATAPSAGDVIRTPPPPMAGGLPDSIIMAPSGSYSSPEGKLRVAVRRGGITEIATSRWEAVGFFDGRQFQGLMRVIDDKGIPAAAEYGSVRFSYLKEGEIDAVVGYPGGTVRQEVRWTRQAEAPNEGRRKPPIVVTPPSGDELKFGEYVYIEELPEPLTRVQPVLTDAMKAAGIEGVVQVQALVGKDGLVKDTKIVKSIPGLDAAAVEAVRQWKFKPALSKGHPVEVWVAVPVRFSRGQPFMEQVPRRGQ